MVKLMKAKKKREDVLPLERQNFVLMGVGILLIVAGYVALLEKTVTGFLPLYVAPVLLVLGYCVVVPLGILYTRKSSKAPTEQGSAVE